MSQTPPAETQIQISILNDIIQTMIDSYNGYKTCLQDFQDDEIMISQDFYEVLKAYQRHHRAA